MLLDMVSSLALSALDTYIAVLSASSDCTHQAEDRGRYRDHLANAAKLFHLLYRGDMIAFKELISVEQRSYGWGFLSGDEGAAAEAAFAAFAADVVAL
jgi:hypothetical protein